MKRITAFVLAVILACLNAFAQQPTLAYHFLSQVSTGKSIGGYEFTSDTAIDTMVLNDAGDVAFTAHRLNGGDGSDQTAVLTPQHVVARAGQVIDGKKLVRIATTVLAVNNAGHIAFEALYDDSGSGGKLKGAVFVDKHLAVGFEPFTSGVATEFSLSDDDKVTLKDVPPAPARGTWGPRNPGQDTRRLQNAVINHSPLKKFRDIFYGAESSEEQLERDVKSKPKPPATKPAKTEVSPSAAAILSVKEPACKLPVFPAPSEWQMGADASGPVASHVYEAPVKGRSYDSPFYGHLTSPFRTIQFSADCRTLVVTIGDTSARGRLELHTPAGVLTYVKPDGFYAFPGVSEKINAGPFINSDAALRINRRGQLLLSGRTQSEGIVLLLATPIGGVN